MDTSNIRTSTLSSLPDVESLVFIDWDNSRKSSIFAVIVIEECYLNPNATDKLPFGRHRHYLEQLAALGDKRGILDDMEHDNY